MNIQSPYRALPLCVLLLICSASAAPGADAASGKSAKAQVDVNGTWAVGSVIYKVTQTGDTVVSESSFGRAEGHFTGPNTFEMTFFGNSTFTATVQGDTIYWSNNFRWVRQGAAAAPGPSTPPSQPAPTSPSSPSATTQAPTQDHPLKLPAEETQASVPQMRQTVAVLYSSCEANNRGGGTSTLDVRPGDRVYFSSIFPMSAYGGNGSKAMDAFKGYMDQHYSLKARVQCHFARSANEAESQKKASQARYLQRAEGKLEIVETGWTYDVAPVAEPTRGRAQAPAIAAPPSQETAKAQPLFYYSCAFVYSPPNVSPSDRLLVRVFYSSVFQASGMVLSKIQESFGRYIQEQYSLQGATQCRFTESATQAEADKTATEKGYLQRWEGQSEIVETGWVYGAAPATEETRSRTQPPATGAPGQVPANASQGAAGVTGMWCLSHGKIAQPSMLSLRQDGGHVSGTLDQLPLEGTIDGDQIHFTVKGANGGTQDCKGTVQGNRMDGVRSPYRVTPVWQATRRH